MNIEYLAKAMITIGIVVLVAGIALYFGGKLGLGRLPGDILVRKGSFTFYFPLVTCIIISILLTLVLRLFRR